MEHLGGERGVVGVLRLGERVAVDEQRLRDGELHLVGRLDEVFERVLEVVRRVDHVAQGGHRAAAVRRRAQDDEEELVRVDRPDGEVVVAVLRVVEVEAAESAGHRQAAHDLLDVRVRQVVAEVDEALGASPACWASSSDDPQSAFTLE